MHLFNPDVCSGVWIHGCGVWIHGSPWVLCFSNNLVVLECGLYKYISIHLVIFSCRINSTKLSTCMVPAVPGFLLLVFMLTDSCWYWFSFLDTSLFRSIVSCVVDLEMFITVNILTCGCSVGVNCHEIVCNKFSHGTAYLLINFLDFFHTSYNIK